MAKALQCPECGTRHPLADLGDVRTFRCHSCARLLKVPTEALAAVPAGTGRSEPPESGPATQAVSAVAADTAGATSANGSRVPPSARGVPLREPRPHRAGADRGLGVPRALRALVWVVALPAGLLLVLAVGRATGLLGVEAAVDVFIGVGWKRFVPPFVLVPVWAATSATLAHFTIEGLGRVLHRDGRAEGPEPV